MAQAKTRNADIAETVSVAKGGSGATTLTGILLGNGTSAFTPITTSAGIASALSDETGSGALVFATSPTLVTPLLGTPTSGTLTNCIGLPVATGISGLGTGVATALAVNVGSAGAFVTFNGALGTPSSGTLTNATGLPIAGLVASTSTALGVGSIELGNASDTTLSRSSAGVLAVEGVAIPSISSTNTLTNKRIGRRVVSTTQSATPTINTDNTDVATITGLAQAITSFTTNLSGTATATDFLEIQITDNGTARALTFGASFAATTIALPTTTVINTKLRILFEWGGSTWDCVAVA